MMKLVFFGTPQFAIPSLYSLDQSKYKVCAVITAPDKRAGRGMEYASSPVKKVAENLNYPIYQPSNLDDPNFASILKKINADIFIVVAYRILPQGILSIPIKGIINIHASLLPKYRGASPIQHAILNGEKITGVTTFYIENEIDAGKILLQESYHLDNNITAGEAYTDLSHIGSKLIIETLDGIGRANLESKKQDHKSVSFAPKIPPKDYIINWNMPAKTIHNQIRALSPKPGAYTIFQNKRIKLFNTEIKDAQLSSKACIGKIDYNNGCLEIGTIDNIIKVHEIQIEGKKRMPVNQFISGTPEIKGAHFGQK